MDGKWITDEDCSTQTLYRLFEAYRADDLLTPIMEGVFNYAIYTLGVEK
jgi:hypothetical protein